ncbi:GGDEF domain-containing protein [Ruminococcus flavefaciens]|nr:diguanylate cyclase [Ruminococcus flavefaciens]
MLNIKEMMYFNIGSIAFYLATLIFVPILKNEKSLLIYLSDIEIIAHATYATHLLGWKPDFAMFLLLIIPATFLTQSRRFYIPFIITFISMGTYLYLKLTVTDDTVFKYVLEDAGTLRAMHMTNVFICVFIMVFSSAIFMLHREYMEFKLINQRETFKNLASIDPLTQLYNRRAMNENIRTIRRECPTPSTSYVIGIGDIDNFKRINDTYGHDIGDKVLVYVANLFISLIPKGGYAARWGGEEFLFVIPEATIKDGVEFTEKIHKSLRAHIFEIEDCEFGVTMTFGVNTGIQTDKIDSVITKADKRLYKGKNNGKNHTEFTD